MYRIRVMYDELPLPLRLCPYVPASDCVEGLVLVLITAWCHCDGVASWLAVPGDVVGGRVQ